MKTNEVTRIYAGTKTELGIVQVQRLCCNACGKTVSSPFVPVPTELEPSGNTLVVRAWIECPECMEKRER